MKPPEVIAADRKPLPLGGLVGRGGEGEVWAVRGDDGLVVKLYTGGRAPQREPKVRAMLDAALSRSSALIAYPSALVLEAPPASTWSEGFDLVAVWAAIERVTPPPSVAEPVIALDETSASGAATAARRYRVGRKFLGVLAIAVAVVIGLFAPAIWPVWLGAAGFGLSRLFGEADEARFTKDYERTDRAWSEALWRWREGHGVERFQTAKDALGSVRADYERLATEESTRLQEAENGRRDRQLRTWLEQFQIRRVALKGVGPGKVATLASYGIETAAEVEAGRLLRVPGFGPVNSKPLLEWRRRLEGRFRYDPKPSAADAQRAASIRANVAAKAAKLRLELSAGPATLARFAGEVAAAQRQVSTELIRLKRERAQAAADLRYLDRPVPASRPFVPPNPPKPTPISRTRPSTPPPPRPHSSAAPSAVACPKCGSRMLRRTARRGANAGNRFWGCSRYPGCRGTRSIP